MKRTHSSTFQRFVTTVLNVAELFLEKLITHSEHNFRITKCVNADNSSGSFFFEQKLAFFIDNFL